MVLVPENTLERLQQRQQILTPPVTQTLRNLDSEMTDILSSKELDDEQKAYNSGCILIACAPWSSSQMSCQGALLKLQEGVFSEID